MPVPVVPIELLPEPAAFGVMPGGQAELLEDGLVLSELLELVEDELPVLGTQSALLPLEPLSAELPLPAVLELGAFVDGVVDGEVVGLLPVPKLEPPDVVPPDVVPPVCAKAAVPSESATIDAAVSRTRFI